MSSSRHIKLCLLLTSLALGVAPAMARTSRDGIAATHQGKLGQDLFLAIVHGDLAGVQSLLARGADPNARNCLEMTPLMVASGSGQVPVAEALLRGGATLDAPTVYGTALTAAASGPSSAMVKFLMARGANPNPSRPDGATVLMLAARNGDPEIINELLSRKVDVNAKDGDGATALIYAAREGGVDVGRVLLSSGAAVDAVDSRRWTAVMYAAVNGHDDFVKLLLEKGANVNAREEKGRTPLILTAIYGDHPAVLRALVEGGADLRATDATHRTALALATARGYTESAALLRERGVELGLAAEYAAPRTPTAAVHASLSSLQGSMRAFTKLTGCVSCHQDGLGRMATAAARAHGFTIDPAVARAQAERVNAALAELQPVHLKALKDPSAMINVPLIEIGDITMYYSYLLAGVVAHQQPANQAISATALVLARQQLPDGYWHYGGPRGPMQSSFFTMTALAVRAMRAYPPKDRAAELADRLRRAKAWLLTAPAQTTEDKAFRLLGLKWVGASQEECRKAIEELRADQRPDGGWPQPGAPQSDAYGTGQALYALRVGGGLPVTDPAYQRGVQFLLRTQEEDGSWFVTKRVAPLNDYFDAAFAHGESQYASFNATCWATMALLQTVDHAPPGPQRAARDTSVR